MTPDTDFTMLEGDSALFPPAIAGEARNDGTEEAVAWIVTVAHQTGCRNANPLGRTNTERPRRHSASR